MFYLYFVLPPVVIVVSLALIIFLISRKSLEIERQVMVGKKDENESRFSMTLKSFWFKFLEKLAHWFKIFSLKMHNWIENRLKFIKTRKSTIELNLEKTNGKKIENDTEIFAQKETSNNIKNSQNNFSDDAPVVKNIETVEAEVDEKKSPMDVVKGEKISRFRGFFRKKEKEQEEILEREFSVPQEIQEEEAIMVSEKVAYPEEERKDELENILVERIASDPRDIEAYERLGDYYVSQGNRNDAEACYKQVLKLNPQSLSVRNKLSRFKRQKF